MCSVTAGYCGGDEENPRYEDVKHQKTYHRETIRITYNPDRISYRELLELFFGSVDLTDGGGQYADRGRSYTLAVYYRSAEEKNAAEETLASFERRTGQSACVSVEAYKNFYSAEECHQDYYRKNPEAFEREMTESGRKR